MKGAINTPLGKEATRDNTDYTSGERGNQFTIRKRGNLGTTLITPLGKEAINSPLEKRGNLGTTLKTPVGKEAINTPLGKEAT